MTSTRVLITAMVVENRPVREVAATPFLGQVKVAEHNIPHPDGYAEERFHRRMVPGKPVGIRMLAEVMQPQRLRIPDQQAKNTVAGGERSDLVGEVLLDPHRDEVA